MSNLSVTPQPVEIRGPSAFGGSWKRFWALTWMLAFTEFRLTYFGSALGYLWSLMRPLMLFGVLYLVFTQIASFGDEVPDYPVLLLMNIMLFNFFTEATQASVSAVVNREPLVRKMHFPRLVIPLAVVLTAFMNLAVNLVAVILFLVVYGIEPMWTWLLLPVALLPFVIIATGMAMILSALYVRFRDVAPIWAVAGTALFYASPVLYPIDKAPEALRNVLELNPFTGMLEQMRKWMIDPHAISGISALGGMPKALFAIGLVAAIFAVGLWFYEREAPKAAELL